MKIKLDDGAKRPTKAHSTDAGYDIYSMERKIVPPHGSSTFHTGVHIELPKGTAGVLMSKSGLNVWNDITSAGLIDEGYTGEIMVKLYNHSDEEFVVQNGMKISQLVIIDVRHEELEVVDELDKNTDRGDNGFGSTGRY